MHATREAIFNLFINRQEMQMSCKKIHLGTTGTVTFKITLPGTIQNSFTREFVESSRQRL